MITNAHQVVQAIINTLDASEYLVRLIHDSKPPINKRLDADQLLHEVSYYKSKNTEGYNVYFRPIGYEYVLLDDLTRSSLLTLATLKPSLLIETSPDNFQAWLRLSNIPQGRDVALQICKELATLLGADMGSAEPDHIGRLAGYTNRKPKHRAANGLYPFVRLHKWEKRECEFIPLRGACGEEISVIPHNKTSDLSDRSREDFNLCCMLINQGKTDDFIRYELELRSEKAKARKGGFDYIGTTIKNARTRMQR
jgi:hypothetical protein